MTNSEQIGVLLPESLAQEGLEFVFIGSSSACEKCPLNKYCVKKLSHGRRYKVVQVIEPKSELMRAHRCPLTNEPIKSVILEAKRFEVNLPNDRAIPKMVFRFNLSGCTNYLCPQRPYCNYEGIPKEAKVEVVEVLEDVKIKCPKGKSLKRVIIRIKEET